MAATPADDARHMRRALTLAARARGATGTNPMVGCVITDRRGRVVGEGYHEQYGGPHAEVNALSEAGDAARGGTVYVTLEPCSHFGKTPPCADAVVAAGPARVVVAMQDPFPEVSGRGLDRLRDAGITVEVGLLQRQARLLNAAFLKRVATGQPFVTVKYAMTLDGRVATRTGHSKWISGPAARRIVHKLRGEHDVILAGIGTVLADDPLLTPRPPGPAACARYIIDPYLQTPPDSQLLRTATEADPVTLLCRDDVPTRPLRDAAPHLRAIPIAVQDGSLPIPAILDALTADGIGSVFVEGGSRVVGRFFDTPQPGCPATSEPATSTIDAAHVFIAPKFAGGESALGPIGGHGRPRIPETTDFTTHAVRTIEGDIYVRGLLQKPWLAPE